jgi:hypothetical protein
VVKRIRHVSALPEWYSLAKYKKAESLDAAGWYEQLLVRRRLLSIVGLARKESSGTNGLAPLGIQATELIELTRTTPIISLKKNSSLRPLVYGIRLTADGSLSSNPSYSRGVHVITVRSFYETERLVQKEKRDYAREYFNRHESGDWVYFEKYKPMDWMDKPIDAFSRNRDFSANVRVNLSLPDNVLQEHFKELLKDIRTAFATTGGPSENKQRLDFEAWQSLGILPYLDLRVWELEDGIKIPNRVIADAIFPRGQGGEETVRKTTTKIAEKLLTSEHLETLAAIAAQQIIERMQAEKDAGNSPSQSNAE